MQATPAVLVLGIGNLLWADEGFGVRAVEHLHRHWAFADNVRLADGGTQGIYLVQDIREADILVVFDAVDYGLPPATMKLVEGEDVPSFMGAKKVSLHQTGFQEVLAMAEMMGEPRPRCCWSACNPKRSRISADRCAMRSRRRWSPRLLPRSTGWPRAGSMPGGATAAPRTGDRQSRDVDRTL
jgi:hydrogenase expression/formation protein